MVILKFNRKEADWLLRLLSKDLEGFNNGCNCCASKYLLCDDEDDLYDDKLYNHFIRQRKKLLKAFKKAIKEVPNARP